MSDSSHAAPSIAVFQSTTRGPELSVAIIGAGIAGLAAGRALAHGGLRPVIFDKGRRVGGRMNTRRQEGHQFDHGAQYVTARAERFRVEVERWRTEGILRAWDFEALHFDGDGVSSLQPKRRWVASDSNRALPEALADGLDVRLETRVAPVSRNTHWTLKDTESRALGDYSVLIVTAPMPQARELLASYPEVHGPLENVDYEPCWTVMVQFADRVAVDAQVITAANKLGWAALESSKPGRPAGHRWTLQGTPAWSRERLEQPPSVVVHELLGAFEQIVGALPKVGFATAHRWRYARVSQAQGTAVVVQRPLRLVVAGDGLLGARVEAAWLSGTQAAETVLSWCKES